MDISKVFEFVQGLKPGDPVRVRWGYGSGFRASGLGKVVKLFPKSVQVELTEPVFMNASYGFVVKKDKPDWPVGFVLKGIPLYPTGSNKWSWEHCVLPADSVEAS